MRCCTAPTFCLFGTQRGHRGMPFHPDHRNCIWIGIVEFWVCIVFKYVPHETASFLDGTRRSRTCVNRPPVPFRPSFRAVRLPTQALERLAAQPPLRLAVCQKGKYDPTVPSVGGWHGRIRTDCLPLCCGCASGSTSCPCFLLLQALAEFFVSNLADHLNKSHSLEIAQAADFQLPIPSQTMVLRHGAHCPVRADACPPHDVIHVLPPYV